MVAEVAAAWRWRRQHSVGSSGTAVGNSAKLARATDRRLGVARVIKRYKPLVQGRGRE